jgi:hypothetical protein
MYAGALDALILSDIESPSAATTTRVFESRSHCRDAAEDDELIRTFKANHGVVETEHADRLRTVVRRWGPVPGRRGVA